MPAHGHVPVTCIGVPAHGHLPVTCIGVPAHGHVPVTHIGVPPRCPCACRNLPCVCGSLPQWILDRNITVRTDNSSLGTACGNVPCSSSATASMMLDVDQLMSLRNAVDIDSQDTTLVTWDYLNPPCSGDVNIPDCDMCTDSDTACGVQNYWTGAMLCNWRYVSCRKQRVVALSLPNKGMTIAYLSPSLANKTLIEYLDLSGGRSGLEWDACTVQDVCTAWHALVQHMTHVPHSAHLHMPDSTHACTL